MARGVVQIPIADGKRELSWQIGQAIVQATNEVNPIVPIKLERDADFVVKRLFLVQFPSFGAGIDVNLDLPPQATVQPKDGGTGQGLALVPSYARAMFLNADPKKMLAAHIGLPCPFLIKAGNAFYAQVNHPGAAGTAWVGDLYLVAEGYKVYPYLPEDIPAKISSYAVPFHLNGNGSILSPTAAPANITGQSITISNNGAGKFLVKGMTCRIVDATGADVTDKLMPNLGFQITDSTSGNKRWVDNIVSGAKAIHCPANLMTMGGTFLPFNTPRYIDPAGTIKVGIIWSDIAASAAYVSNNATFPVVIAVDFFGAMMPLA